MLWSRRNCFLICDWNLLKGLQKINWQWLKIREGRNFDWLLFCLLVYEAGQKSFQRKSTLVSGEICKDGTLGLNIRPDCGGEIDKNYNWQVTDLNIYWLQLTMHTYSGATYTYFDLSHTLSQDVTNAWMLHTLSLLHKHTHADVTHNFSDVTHTHSAVPGTHGVDTPVLFGFTLS